MPTAATPSTLGEGRPRPWVVTGVDRSPSAIQALRWAADYVEMAHGTLLAVTACPDVDASYADMLEVVTVMEQHAAEGRLAAQSDIEALVAEVLGDQAGSAVARAFSGGVADILLEASENADLLVIGATPRGRLGRALLSSVRPGHLSRLHCPVVLVRAPDPRR
ncbi:MAG: universal stress protein [Actinomycetota bacterium]|jgi:nucleotide-binding universal stress UspA family protein|nr:universal stress protein [Actinomycetota bacterium]